MTIKMAHSVKPASSDQKAAAFIAGAGAPQDESTGKTVVNMRFDASLLARVDAAAKRLGISRTAWLHVAAARALDAR